MLGLAGGVLFKVNCQGGPHKTPHMLGALIMEHNTNMMETRAERVDQNTNKKADPSTLYQVYGCIK